MDKFNLNHLMFIIWGTCIISLKTYPNIFMHDGGRDSWIAISFSSLLILIYMIYMIKVCIKTNCFNIYAIYKTALGKILGTVFLILYLITLFFTLIESAAVEGNSIHTNMLLETPSWYIILFLIFAALYSYIQGKVAIIILTVIGITLIMFAGINLAILTWKFKHVKYLFPILANGLNFGFWLATFKSLGCYGSISIIFPYLTEIKEKKNITRYITIALLIVIQMEIVSTSGIIMTFDTTAAMMNYPNLLLTQLVSYFGFLESGELYVMLQIVGGWFIKYLLTFYAVMAVLKAMNINHKFLPYIISILSFICSYFAAKNLLTLFELLNLYSYISLINFIILPMIIFTIFYIKKRKVLKNDAKI